MVAVASSARASAELAAGFAIVASEAAVRVDAYAEPLGRLGSLAMRSLLATIRSGATGRALVDRVNSSLVALARATEELVDGALQREGAWSEDATWDVWERELPAPFWGVALRESWDPLDRGVPLLEAKVDRKTAATVRRQSKTAKYKQIIQSSDYKARMRKWSKKIKSHDPIAEIIASGLARHAKPETIAKRVQPFVQGYASSAMRIVRTESARVTNQLAEETFKAFDNAISGFQILSMLDDRVRPKHRSRHGKIYKKGAKRPELPDEPNCRCHYAPVLKADSELFDIPGTPKFSNTTYDEWFAKQPVDIKQRLVGKQRWEIVKKKLKNPQWQDFSNKKTGELLSVSTLQERSSGQLKKRRARQRNARVETGKLEKPFVPKTVEEQETMAYLQWLMKFDDAELKAMGTESQKAYLASGGSLENVQRQNLYKLSFMKNDLQDFRQGKPVGGFSKKYFKGMQPGVAKPETETRTVLPKPVEAPKPLVPVSNATPSAKTLELMKQAAEAKRRREESEAQLAALRAAIAKPVVPVKPQPAVPVAKGSVKFSDNVHVTILEPTNRKATADALAAIDSVHRVGKMPEIRVRTEKMAAHEVMKFNATFTGIETKVKIGINEAELHGRNKTKTVDMIHELGHYMDFFGAGDELKSRDMTTKDFNGGPFHDVLVAIRGTEKYKRLQQTLNDPKYDYNRAYTRYLLDPAETFARSYAQYISNKSDNKQIKKEMELLKKQSLKKGQYEELPLQWTDEDFKPIEAAMDAVFARRGHLIAKPASP